MLSAKEFTVGSIGQAKPQTLVLPRHSTDQMFLIGTSSSNEPMAYVLTGRAQFLCFPSTGNDHWHGLLVPNVRVEVDETSIFDPKQESAKLGSVVRESTFLTLKGTPNGSNAFGRIESMILEDNLMQAGSESAGFTRWDIVLGEGRNKRLLHHVDLSTV